MSSFIVIPEGTMSLRPLIRGKLKTTFDVVLGHSRIGKIELETEWGSLDIPKVNLWSLTQALRNANLIGKESTIVGSFSKHLRFVETSAMSMNLGGGFSADVLED